MNGNSLKYHSSNPLVKFLLDRFFKKLNCLLNTFEKGEALLDVGCGEGLALQNLQKNLPVNVVGLDIDQRSFVLARQLLPGVEFIQGNACSLPFADNSFDTVLCLEVLEHLAEPALALQELLRVSRRYMIISVPHEPFFRLGNFLRLQHLKTWGNHPEHIQHWGRAGFQKFINQNIGKNTGASSTIYSSFPWLIAVIDCRTENYD